MKGISHESHNFYSSAQFFQSIDNDGTYDQNLPMNENSWFWEHIKWENLDYISLEISGQSIETLKNQIELTKRKIKQYYND